MRTFQKTSEAKPEPECRSLGIMIGCAKCLAVRTFKIDTALELLKSRYSAGFIIETECEECGHLIAATIAWIDGKSGYSYKKMPFSATELVLTVHDNMGLRIIKEEHIYSSNGK